ncbi:hypothetical protein BH11CYA1_BH11CYA1_20970 [soil metagenome]
MRHKKLRLVGYLRTGCTELAIEEQRNRIEEYCREHGHHLIGYGPIDEDIPGRGLQDSLKMVQENDGIIAVDLNRFVKHNQDRLFDLRPFVNRMLHENKAIIAVNEQFETQTALGQQNAFEMVQEWSDREATTMGPIHEHIEMQNY